MRLPKVMGVMPRSQLAMDVDPASTLIPAGSTALVVAGAGRYPRLLATLTLSVAETQLAIPAVKQCSLLMLTNFFG